MNLTTMYDGLVNSPQTTISSGITDTATTITVADVSKIPDAPNILVIGGGTANPETVLMTAKVGSDLTVTRAFQGTAQNWDGGTTIGRNFTEYDFATFKENINTINSLLTSSAGMGAFNGYYKVTEFDSPTTGDITETIKLSSDNSTYLTRITEFDTPTTGDITETITCSALSINIKIVTEFDTPTTGDITETTSEVV